MRTITFYSFKGGSGRTLLLANVARFLAWSGKNVVALDLDLEAPGLAYKFGLQRMGDDPNSVIGDGLVDYLLDRQDGGNTGVQPPTSIHSIIKSVQLPPTYPGRIDLIPAGNAPTLDYAGKLAGLRWHDLMYEPETLAPSERLGAKIFRALKHDIAEELEPKPHYLLIDSRTGITDVGGVALNMLADSVVCLMLNNAENIDGMREVIQTLDHRSADWMLVISRIQEGQRVSDQEAEARTISSIASALGVFEGDGSRPARGRPLVLHADRDLEFEEAIRFDGRHTANESLLLRDYCRVFQRLSLHADLDPARRQLVETLAEQPPPMDIRWIADRVGRERILEWPEELRETVKRIQQRDPPNLVYVMPTYHRKAGAFRKLKRFMRQVASELGQYDDLAGAVEKTNIARFTWDHLIANRMLEGEFEFCSEPYFLTWVRSHMVGIVQFGWIHDFSLMVHRDSPLVGDLEALGGRPSSLRTIVENLRANQRPLRIGLLGETAASSEAIQCLAALLGPNDLITRSNEGVLVRWMNRQDPRQTLVACDLVVADSIRSRREELLAYTDSRSLLIPFQRPYPVGIAYPAGDREWRRCISRAVISVLNSNPGVWGTGKGEARGTVGGELAAAGIDVFREQEIRQRLVLDIEFREALDMMPDIAGI